MKPQPLTKEKIYDGKDDCDNEFWWCEGKDVASAVAWFEKYLNHYSLFIKEQPVLCEKWLQDTKLNAGEWGIFLLREAFAGVEAREGK